MEISINYSEHPAFALYFPTSASDPGPANLFFDRLDGLAAEFQQGRSSVDQVGPAMRAVAADYLALARTEPWSSEVRKLIETSAVQTADRFAAETTNRRRALFAEKKTGNSCVDQLTTEGYTGFQLNESDLGELLKAMAAEMRTLEARRAAGETAQLIGRANLKAMRILREFFRRTGVHDALTRLYAKPMSFEGFGLVLSHASDRVYQSPYTDVGLKTTRTVQMHYDEDYWAPKAMVYLNDVGPENGAFSLHPSSQHWPRLGSRLEWRKRLYYLMAGELTSRGLPAGKPVFSHPEARKWFANLPTPMQVTSHPGDDVLDGTPLSEELLRSERQLSGGPGSGFIFTGHDVLHRGGIVSSGERWALQIVFRPTPTMLAKASRLSGSAIRRARSWFN